MNHRGSPRPPVPGPECEYFAALLPIVAQERLSPGDTSRLRQHLATCAYCQAELQSYNWLDETLARHFSPLARGPLSLEEMRAVTSRSYRPHTPPPAPAPPPETRGEQHPRRSVPLRRPAHPQPPQRRRRLLSILSAVAALVVIAALSAALIKSHILSQPGAASPGTTASPQPTAVLPQPTAYVPAYGDILNSISMLSASDGWAVGSSYGSQQPLILHYNGDHWERLNNPSGGTFQAGDARLTQVSMISATEGWAVGSYTDFNNNHFGLILHYTGGRWIPQKTLPNVDLNGLAMLSASDGWAVGNTTSQQSVLLHYTGGVWTAVPLSGLSLNRIVMASPTDGWIVGRSQDGWAVWHYNGTTWAPASIPGMDGVIMISLVSASDGWAVGFKLSSGGAMNARFSSGYGATVFAHYDGKMWTAVQTYTQDMNVTGLSMDASNDGWAVGTGVTGTGAVVGSINIYLHYTGWRWTQVAGPQGWFPDTFSVAMVSASDGWIVDDRGAILRYQQNAWTVVAAPASK